MQNIQREIAAFNRELIGFDVLARKGLGDALSASIATVRSDAGRELETFAAEIEAQENELTRRQQVFLAQGKAADAEKAGQEAADLKLQRQQVELLAARKKNLAEITLLQEQAGSLENTLQADEAARQAAVARGELSQTDARERRLKQETEYKNVLGQILARLEQLAKLAPSAESGDSLTKLRTQADGLVELSGNWTPR